MKTSTLTSLLAAASLATAKKCKPKLDSAKFQADIKIENLMKHLQTFNDIAYANGGNRAFGLPGSEKTIEYIYNAVSGINGTRAWKQEFTALFAQVQSLSIKFDGVEIGPAYGLTYSPSTSAEGYTAELVLGPQGAAGCDVANYANLGVEGKMVLIDRFRCPTGGTLAGRVLPAAQSGAIAVIVYNDVSTQVTAGSLSAPSPEFVPAAFINRADGLAALARIQAGETIEAFMQQTQTVENRTTHNVFVETEEGDADNTIVLGAHLDSVQAGPGINDDASGSSLLIEVFLALTKYRTRNRVRFAWWGAEENGLLGSKYYTQSLAAHDVNQILAYLNFDMQAQGRIGVSDNDQSVHPSAPPPPGSNAIEQIYLEHFAAQGVTVTPRILTNGSDYASFWNVIQKPFGFLQTGILPEEDPCYHQACDNIDNINPDLLILNARAAAHQLTVLSLNGTSIIPKRLIEEEALAMIKARSLMPGWVGAGALDEARALGEHHVGCGHEI